MLSYIILVCHSIVTLHHYSSELVLNADCKLDARVTVTCFNASTCGLQIARWIRKVKADNESMVLVVQKFCMCLLAPMREKLSHMVTQL